MKILHKFGMVNQLNVCRNNQTAINYPEIYEKQTKPELGDINPMTKQLTTNEQVHSKDTFKLERFSLYKILTDCNYITSKGWVNNQLAKELYSPQDILTKFCKKPDSMPDKLSKTKILKYLIKKRASLFFKSREGTLYNILKRSNNNSFLQKALKAHLNCWKEEHMCEYSLLRKRSRGIKVEDNQLTVKKNTFLACTGLRSLPEGLYFKENLNLQFCYKLTVIQNLHVGESLDLNGCFNLDSIFNHLFVGLDLHLSHCHHLSYLSENIFVGRNLNLEYCTEIKGLPKNMFVGGTLNLEMCENITALPQWVLYCFDLNEVPDHLKTTDNFKTFKILKHFDTNSDINTINCAELRETYLENQEMYNYLLRDRHCFRIAYALFRNIGLSNAQKTFKESADADSKDKIRNHLIYFASKHIPKKLIQPSYNKSESVYFTKGLTGSEGILPFVANFGYLTISEAQLLRRVNKELHNNIVDQRSRYSFEDCLEYLKLMD